MKFLMPIISLLLLNHLLLAQEGKIYSSQNYYAKPGAPINIRYSEIRIDMNETADVNITLTTSIDKGTVYVNTLLDKNLETNTQLDTNASFKIQPNQQDFVMNFQVKAKKEGLFYIRLLTKVESQTSKKLRTFAIPIFVGEQKKPVPKSLNSSFKALGTSENISVSQAKETIEVIKER
jgi:hypothetical protein